MAALSGQCAEEGGHGGGERFAFAGLHFGDVAFEHGDGPHDLHGEVSHIQSSSGGFADECVGIGEQLVQWNAGAGFPADFSRHGEQFFVTERCEAIAALNDVFRHGTPA